MAKRIRSTIRDMQNLTGLSVATISRAVNNTGYVSLDSRELVRQAQVQLNYFPRKQAKGAAQAAHGRLIMLVLPDGENPFWFNFIKGVQSICHDNQHFTLLAYADEIENGEQELIQTAMDLAVQGIIVVTLDATEALCHKIEQLPMAKVLCSFYRKDSLTTDSNFDYVSVDTRKGTYLATNHLVMQGYRQIGYVGLTKKTRTGLERYLGYEAALAAHGLMTHADWIKLGDDQHCEQTGYDAIYAFVQAKNMPDAICASNDRVAIGIFRACKELNISMPDQLGLVGMDDIDTTYLVTPTISSVDISPVDLGQTAATILFARMLKDTSLFQSINLEPQLSIKESSCRSI